jgi:hypothetical protein
LRRQLTPRPDQNAIHVDIDMKAAENAFNPDVNVSLSPRRKR